MAVAADGGAFATAAAKTGSLVKVCRLSRYLAERPSYGRGRLHFRPQAFLTGGAKGSIARLTLYLFLTDGAAPQPLQLRSYLTYPIDVGADAYFILQYVRNVFVDIIGPWVGLVYRA